MPNDLEKKLTIIDTVPMFASESPDEQTRIEVNNAAKNEEEYRQEKTNILRQQAKEFEIRNNILSDYRDALKDEKKHRKTWSIAIAWFVIVYIAMALLILLFNKCLGVDPNVLMVLLGSTSVNVVGLVTIIVRFVFTNHHHKILDNK